MNNSPNSQDSVASLIPKNAFFCNVCSITCTDQKALEMHFEGQKHKKKLSLHGAPEGYKCEVCQIVCPGLDQLKSHESGKSHAKMLKKKRDISNGDFAFSETGSVTMSPASSPPNRAAPLSNLETLSEHSSKSGITGVPANLVSAQGTLPFKENSETEAPKTNQPARFMTINGIIKQIAEGENSSGMLRCMICECKFNESLLHTHLTSVGHKLALRPKSPSVGGKLDDDSMSICSDKSMFESDSESVASTQKVLKFQDQSGHYSRFLPKYSVPAGYTPIMEKVQKYASNGNGQFKVPHNVAPISSKSNTSVSHEDTGRSAASTPMEVDNGSHQMQNTSSTSTDIQSMPHSESQHASNFAGSNLMIQKIAQTINSERNHITTLQEKMILNKLDQVMAEDNQLSLIIDTVLNIENAIGLAFQNIKIALPSMQVVDISQTEPDPSETYDHLLLEIRRAENLGIGLFLKNPEDFQFVIVLKYRPSFTLLSLVNSKLGAILNDLYPNDNYTVIEMAGKQSLTTFPIHFVRSFDISFTCPSYLYSNTDILPKYSLIDPEDALDKAKCIETYYQIMRVDWYNKFMFNNDNFFRTICLFNFLKNTVQNTWRCLNIWAIQVYCCKVLSNPELLITNTYDLFYHVLKVISKNNFDNAYFLLDPINNKRPLSVCLEPKYYKDLVHLVSNTVKLIEEGKFENIFMAPNIH